MPQRKLQRFAPLLLPALLLAACSQGAPAPTTSTAKGAGAQRTVIPALAGTPYDGQDHSWVSEGSETTFKALALQSGENMLSGQDWSSATSGWGPIERNRSNGEQGATDGRTLTLNGKTYSSGLGAHADSTISYALNGQCQTFAADLGVDDEVGDRGSVVFRVITDGKTIYDSGVMTGASATKSPIIPIDGTRVLTLQVTNGGDNYYYDHANWASARLLCTTSAAAPAAPAAPPTVTYQGPLVITKGGTYTGNYQSTDPNVPAIFVKTSEPVIIENANLRGSGDLIKGWWNNLTVRNTRGYGLNPNVYGRVTGRFISAEQVVSLNVHNNYMEGTTGIYTNVFEGNRAAGQTIKILRNVVKNIDGRKSNGAGGYLNERELVQFVQMAKLRDVPGMEVAWNQVINEPGKSSLEENINMYQSSGTAGSRVKIHNNYIQGAYAIYPGTDSGYSGGGVMLGDGDTSSMSVAGGHVDVYDNQIISTSNQGVGLAGGHNQSVYNNRVISSGRLADGTRILAQNVGIYVWDINNGTSKGTFFNNVVRDNQIGWTRINTNGSTWLNNMWLPNCSSSCYNNTTWSGAVTVDTERAEFTYWQNKLASAGVKVGPQ